MALKTLISVKADKDDLEEVKVSKSNKTDLNLSWTWIEQLHKQLRHTCMIVSEYLKLAITPHPLSDMERLGKVTFLSSQCEAVASWIDKFDQQDPTVYFPNESKVTQKYQSARSRMLSSGTLMQKANNTQFDQFITDTIKIPTEPKKIPTSITRNHQRVSLMKTLSPGGLSRMHTTMRAGSIMLVTADHSRNSTIGTSFTVQMPTPIKISRRHSKMRKTLMNPLNVNQQDKTESQLEIDVLKVPFRLSPTYDT